MRRREFIGLIGGAAAWPLAVRAQQSSKMKRIAMVSAATKIGDMRASGYRIYRVFFEELSRLGYVEGQNLVVERYSAEGRSERYADLARDVVSAHPDLVVTTSIPIALNLKMPTTTIPIVAITADPVVAGLVPSLARPGGNITGVSTDAGLELYGKRLGLLAEAIPKMSNARYLASQSTWAGPYAEAAREAARRADISLAGALLGSPINEAEYQRVFNSMEQDRVDALMVAEEPVHFTYRRLLVELAAKSRIPAIYPFREHVELGGLMSYSADLLDIFRRAARQTAEILKGANPGEIPFYQPTRFDLVINLKTAKELGLTIPEAFLLRADQVIE
jgi:putative tryptophan/tyrosine transport system substrate-binding protein